MKKQVLKHYGSIFFKLIITLSCFYTHDLIKAQAIEGIVTDGVNPISSAYVQIKNSNIGTVTNKEGKYNLPNAIVKSGDSIVISYVGYETETIPVLKYNKGKPLETKLVAAELFLPEVKIVPFVIQGILTKLQKTISEGNKKESFNTQGFLRQILIENDTLKEIADLSVNTYYSYSEDQFQVHVVRGRSFNNGAQMTLINSTKNIARHDLSFSLPEFLNIKHYKDYNYKFIGYLKYDTTVVYNIVVTPKNSKKNKLSFAQINIDTTYCLPIDMTVYFKPDNNPVDLLINNYKVVSIDSNFYSAGFKYIENHVVMIFFSSLLKPTYIEKSTQGKLHQTMILSFMNNDFMFSDVKKIDKEDIVNPNLPLSKQIEEDNCYWQDRPFWEIEKEFLVFPKPNNNK